MNDRLHIALSDCWPLVFLVIGSYGTGAQAAGMPWWVHALCLSALMGALATGYYRARFGGNRQ